MGAALGRLAEEDPTFRVRTNEETGQTLIDGMGELHLEVIVDRMLREFRVEANVGRPQVAYRETITQPGSRRRRPHSPDRRRRPVRSLRRRVRAAGARHGLRLRRQDRRRLDSARIHPGRSRGHPGSDGDRWRTPAIRWSTSRPRWSTARTTMWTRRKWRTRSPARWRSRKRYGGASRSCSSRSWRSRSPRPKSSWVMSSAT